MPAQSKRRTYGPSHWENPQKHIDASKKWKKRDKAVQKKLYLAGKQKNTTQTTLDKWIK